MIEASLIIPLYNEEKNIDKLFKMIFSQKILPKEIIFIDAGSIDETNALVKNNIYAYQKLGANVTVCGPKSLIPNDIESLDVTVDTDFISALKHCDAVNMLRIQNERMSESYFPSVREYVQQYGLNKSILDSLDKKIIVMHPGPIKRGVEITSEIADSDQAIILDQVENGVAIRMAVMYLLAAKLK